MTASLSVTLNEMQKTISPYLFLGQRVAGSGAVSLIRA
jgi:hypothetical protein